MSICGGEGGTSCLSPRKFLPNVFCHMKRLKLLLLEWHMKGRRRIYLAVILAWMWFCCINRTLYQFHWTMSSRFFFLPPSRFWRNLALKFWLQSLLVSVQEVSLNQILPALFLPQIHALLSWSLRECRCWSQPSSCFLWEIFQMELGMKC